MQDQGHLPAEAILCLVGLGQDRQIPLIASCHDQGGKPRARKPILMQRQVGQQAAQGVHARIDGSGQRRELAQQDDRSLRTAEALRLHGVGLGIGLQMIQVFKHDGERLAGSLLNGT